VFQVITLHRIVSLFWHTEEPDLISMKMEAARPSKTVEQISDPAVCYNLENCHLSNGCFENLVTVL